MKIDIPAYPHGKLKRNKMDAVINNSVAATEPIDTSKRQFIIEEINGELFFYRFLPVINEQKTYASPFPNPVHLYLSLALENFTQSENYKSQDFPKHAIPLENDLYLLGADDGNTTHSCYTSFMKLRAASIIMLVAALETFMNHIISSDFTYVNDRNTSFNKEKIERRIMFMEKIEKVIPQFLDKPDFWEPLHAQLQIIKTVYRHRKNLIHLKTENEGDLKRYYSQMEGMVKFDVLSSINASIEFMNVAKPNFITVK